MIDPNTLLDRIERLAVHVDQGTRRTVDLTVERDKWRNDRDTVERELKAEQEARKKVEVNLFGEQARAAVLRIDLKEKEGDLDSVCAAARALLNVQTGKGSVAMRKAAAKILRKRVQEIDDKEIPF